MKVRGRLIGIAMDVEVSKATDVKESMGLPTNGYTSASEMIYSEVGGSSAAAFAAGNLLVWIWGPGERGEV